MGGGGELERAVNSQQTLLTHTEQDNLFIKQVTQTANTSWKQKCKTPAVSWYIYIYIWFDTYISWVAYHML